MNARPFKKCGCGREHTREEWRSLKFVGLSYGLELRNCQCGSTIAVVARVEPEIALVAGRLGFGMTRAHALVDGVLRALGNVQLGGASC